MVNPATLLLLCLLTQTLLTAHGAGPTKASSVAKADIPFIQCSVCEHAVERAWTASAAIRKVRKRPDEDAFVEVAEKLCAPAAEHGSWLASVDLKRSWDRLEVIVRHERGHCKEECRTAAAACRKVLDHWDLDLAEALYNRKIKTLRKLQNKVCRKWAKVCGKGKTPPVPESYVRADEAFKAKSDADVEMDELMAKMKAAGLGGMSVFNRDEIGELDEAGEL